MCSINESITLSESLNSQLSWCKCCRTFSLIHNSCCASFMQLELQQFKQTLDNLGTQDYRFLIMNQWYVVVKNPDTCVGFCLTKNETDSLLAMIDEALVLYEAFHIIYDAQF